MSRNFITPIGDEGIYTLDTGSWRTFRPIMNKDKCVECGICMSFCPVGSITGNEQKVYTIGYEFCKGCGICAYECPSQAINMAKEGD